jgi:hypothetical protein
LKISGIYKIVNPKGKIYVGQSVNIYRRIKSYYEPSSSKSQIILKNSFKKYGVENHKFYIIEKCSTEELNTKERYWQDFYKDKLLNCRFTESKDKTGYCSEQTKKNIGNALKQTDASYKHLKKKVYQYSSDGSFIKEWESLREASRILNVYCSTICKCLKKDSPNKSAKGFLWSYNKSDKLIGYVGQEAKKIKVGQYTLSKELIKIFNSITEASKELNIDKSNIIRVCKNRQKQAKNFIFSYEEARNNI